MHRLQLVFSLGLVLVLHINKSDSRGISRQEDDADTLSDKLNNGVGRRKRAAAKTTASSAAHTVSTSTPDYEQVLAFNLSESRRNPHGFQFVGEEEIKHHTLKYRAVNDSKRISFDPPWAYGDEVSTDWHNVPMEYFTGVDTPNVTQDQVLNHRSIMRLCSKRVLSLMEPGVADKKAECHKSIKNECMSLKPSPRNILTSEVGEDNSLGSFTTYNFDTKYGFTLFFPEDGTNMFFMQLKVPDAKGRKPSISGPNVNNEQLYLDRIQFHVGDHDHNGAEHYLDGRQFEMEIQFFFTPGQPYWEELAEERLLPYRRQGEIGRKVHAFSVLVEVMSGSVSKRSKGRLLNRALDLISEGAQKFWSENNPGMNRAVHTRKRLIRVSDILGEAFEGAYYMYEGSMTTPPCLTGVTWTVFENPILITYQTWFNFIEMSSEYSMLGKFRDTFRPLGQIYLSLDVITYAEIRKTQGWKPIQQKVLDYIAHKDYITEPYEPFPIWFSRKIRKGTQQHLKARGEQELVVDSADAANQRDEN